MRFICSHTRLHIWISQEAPKAFVSDHPDLSQLCIWGETVFLSLPSRCCSSCRPTCAPTCAPTRAPHEGDGGAAGEGLKWCRQKDHFPGERFVPTACWPPLGCSGMHDRLHSVDSHMSWEVVGSPPGKDLKPAASELRMDPLFKV